MRHNMTPNEHNYICFRFLCCCCDNDEDEMTEEIVQEVATAKVEMGENLEG